MIPRHIRVEPAATPRCGTRPCSEHPPRYGYHVTQAGADLRPIVLALKEWGDQHANPGEEPVVLEHTRGAEFHPLTVCAACKAPVASGEPTVKCGTHPVQGQPWREGWTLKRTRRVWRQEGLGDGPRKRGSVVGCPAGTNNASEPPQRTRCGRSTSSSTRPPPDAKAVRAW
jgi:hypothetical protein